MTRGNMLRLASLAMMILLLVLVLVTPTHRTVDASMRAPQATATPEYPVGDLNHDCVVDITDFAILRQHFGETCDITNTPTATVTPAVTTTPTATPAAANQPFPGSTFYRDISQAPLNTSNQAWRALIANYPLDNTFNAGYWNGYPNGQRPYTDTVEGTTIIPVDTIRYPSLAGFNRFPYRASTFKTAAPSDLHLNALVGHDLYEAWHARYANGRLTVDSSAHWDTRSNQMLPEGWGAADAAGMPMYPLIYRCCGPYDHAARITLPADVVSRAHVWPAVHSDGETGQVPMGTRVRLQATYQLQCSCPQAQAIVAALKRYGAFVADTDGTERLIGLDGEWNQAWNTNDLANLRQIQGSAFEFVNNAAYMVSPTSYQSR